jgi:SAM-dependent methyltransferase
MPEDLRLLDKRFYKHLRTLPNYPNLKILDLSCGDGYLLSKLAADGCKCTGTRYRDDDYILSDRELHPSIALQTGIDLTAPLPFDSGIFDVVILQEVIEHLPEYRTVLSEASRVLKNDGQLFLSTPNIQRLHSRLHFFLTGAHKLIRRRIGWDLEAGDLYAYHQNPVDFPILHTLLHHCDLQIDKLVTTRVKQRSWLYAFFVPLFIVPTILEFRCNGVRGSSSNEGERDLRKWMLSAPMLFSEQLFLIAQKGSKDSLKFGRGI